MDKKQKETYEEVEQIMDSLTDYFKQFDDDFVQFTHNYSRWDEETKKSIKLQIPDIIDKMKGQIRETESVIAQMIEFGYFEEDKESGEEIKAKSRDFYENCRHVIKQSEIMIRLLEQDT